MRVKNINDETVVSKVAPLETAVRGYSNFIGELVDMLNQHHACSMSVTAEPDADFIRRNLMDVLKPVAPVAVVSKGFGSRFVTASKKALGDAGFVSEPGTGDAEFITECLELLADQAKKRLDAVSKFGIGGNKYHDRVSGKYGYVAAIAFDDGCCGYLEVHDGNDLTGEIISVDMSCLDIVKSYPVPAPSIPRPTLGKFSVNGYEAHVYYADRVGANARVILVNDLESSLPVATPFPGPAPLCLDDGERAYAKWLSGGWYYELEGVNKKITQLTASAPLAPSAADIPCPYQTIDVDGCDNQSYPNYFNGMWWYSAEVVANKYMAPAPLAPESHVYYPEAAGETERRKITSKSVDGHGMFHVSDVLMCFEAWEQVDSLLHRGLSKLRHTVGGKSLNHVQVLEKLLTDHKARELALSSACREFKIDVSLSDADMIDLLHRRLKSAEACAEQVHELDLTPGSVICGEKMAIESLSDQWVKVYKTVQSSAGATSDSAVEAAHNFVELIK